MSLEKQTAVTHANNGGKNKMESGLRHVKKQKIKTAREAWPDGKLNLSGPKENGLSSTVGRLLLIAALISATMIMSMTRPKIKCKNKLN